MDAKSSWDTLLGRPFDTCYSRLRYESTPAVVSDVIGLLIYVVITGICSMRETYCSVSKPPKDSYSTNYRRVLFKFLACGSTCLYASRSEGRVEALSNTLSSSSDDILSTNFGGNVTLFFVVDEWLGVIYKSLGFLNTIGWILVLCFLETVVQDFFNLSLSLQ